MTPSIALAGHSFVSAGHGPTASESGRGRRVWPPTEAPGRVLSRAAVRPSETWPPSPNRAGHCCGGPLLCCCGPASLKLGRDHRGERRRSRILQSVRFVGLNIRANSLSLAQPNTGHPERAARQQSRYRTPPQSRRLGSSCVALRFRGLAAQVRKPDIITL